MHRPLAIAEVAVFHWSANGADGSRKTWTAYLERDASGALSLDVRPEIRSETYYNFNSSHEWKCTPESSAQIIDCSTSSPSGCGVERHRTRTFSRAGQRCGRGNSTLIESQRNASRSTAGPRAVIAARNSATASNSAPLGPIRHPNTNPNPNPRPTMF